MVVEEREIEVAPGVFIWAFTFNGSVPGPIIVVHEGDYVELTLVNPVENELAHNIDFQCLHRGAGRWPVDTSVPRRGSRAAVPGHQTRSVHLPLRAKRTHGPLACGPWDERSHNGIPREGLRDQAGNPIRYDRAYYIGEQDYYIPRDENGDFRRYDSPAASLNDDIEVMSTLIPTHIVFNGVTGALQGDGELTANVGENVLIVHSQANRQSYPHLIGGHGDYVWERGAFNSPPRLDLETWVIAAGSAGAFDSYHPPAWDIRLPVPQSDRGLCV